MKQKILVATSNQGKFKEMLHLLGDLPFDFLSLLDLPEKITEPEETGETLEANAILKAKYYAEKTGLITISEDTGLFVEALNGWPGVKAARVGNNDEERKKFLLEKMNGIPKEKRGASFMTCAVCYNPINQNTFLSYGEVKGEILDKEAKINDLNFGYNPLFFVPELNKAFSEMTLSEKNSISQRGKAIKKMAYYLNHEFGSRHIVVPVAIVIKNGKILLAKRYDPHNVEYHGKWELSGGIVEMGETLEENLIKEVKEELGYKVEIIEKINYIHLNHRIGKDFEYQVYLIPFVCKILEKISEINDSEVMETTWIQPDDYINFDYIADNKTMMKNIIPAVKEIIKNNNL